MITIALCQKLGGDWVVLGRIESDRSFWLEFARHCGIQALLKYLEFLWRQSTILRKGIAISSTGLEFVFEGCNFVLPRMWG